MRNKKTKNDTFNNFTNYSLFNIACNVYRMLRKLFREDTDVTGIENPTEKRMSKELKSEINAMITRRILAFRRILIDTGQIQDVGKSAAQANPNASRYNQSAHEFHDDALADHSLLELDPLH